MALIMIIGVLGGVIIGFIITRFYFKNILTKKEAILFTLQKDLELYKSKNETLSDLYNIEKELYCKQDKILKKSSNINNESLKNQDALLELNKNLLVKYNAASIVGKEMSDWKDTLLANITHLREEYIKMRIDSDLARLHYLTNPENKIMKSESVRLFKKSTLVEDLLIASGLYLTKEQNTKMNHTLNGISKSIAKIQKNNKNDA